MTLALFVAGFAAATWPAVAELRTITITLVGGQEIVTTVDVPPGTPANQIKLPEISAPIAGVRDGTKKRPRAEVGRHHRPDRHDGRNRHDGTDSGQAPKALAQLAWRVPRRDQRSTWDRE